MRLFIFTLLRNPIHIGEFMQKDWNVGLLNKTARPYICAFATLKEVELGKGYRPRALTYYRQLFIYFPDRKILQTRLQNLTWSHLQAILGGKERDGSMVVHR